MLRHFSFHQSVAMPCLLAALVGLPSAPLIAASAGATASPVQHAVRIAEDGCTPDRFSLTEGEHAFVVSNQRKEVAKWKILRGAHTIAGLDEISPGTTASIETHLDEGRYRILCGRPTDPKGRLIVGEAVADGTLDPQALAGVVKGYTDYVNQEVDHLRATVQALSDAARAGDLARAQTLYATARGHAAHIEPAIELFRDIDRAMNASLRAFRPGPQEAQIAGFQRIEEQLFVRNDLQGAAAEAQQLVPVITDLKRFFHDVEITPRQIVDGASNLVENGLQYSLAGEDDPFSHGDLGILQARLEGTRRIVDLLRPTLTVAAPALQASIDRHLATLDSMLQQQRRGESWPSLEALPRQDFDRLRGTLIVLAEALGDLRSALKLG